VPRRIARFAVIRACSVARQSSVSHAAQRKRRVDARQQRVEIRRTGVASCEAEADGVAEDGVARDVEASPGQLHDQAARRFCRIRHDVERRCEAPALAALPMDDRVVAHMVVVIAADGVEDHAAEQCDSF